MDVLSASEICECLELTVTKSYLIKKQFQKIT